MICTRHKAIHDLSDETNPIWGVSRGLRQTLMATPLILKRGDPSRRRAGELRRRCRSARVVGRIFHLDAAAPEGRPWMWASGHGGHNIKCAAHGYAATRAEAVGAVAKSWRREGPLGQPAPPKRGANGASGQPYVP